MNAVRDWTPADGPGIDALLDENPDPLWANQGHRMHGAPREGERWRRTWVAEENDAVVGAVTLGRNWVHPDRYTCVVEVAPEKRQRGLGRRPMGPRRLGAGRPGARPHRDVRAGERPIAIAYSVAGCGATAD